MIGNLKGKGYRDVFTGIVASKIRMDKRENKNTVKIEDILNSNNEMIKDHYWFDYTGAFQRKIFRVGDGIEFESRVKYRSKKRYGRRPKRGSSPYDIDIEFSPPKKIRNLGGGKGQLINS